MKTGLIGQNISYSLSPKIHFGLSGDEYKLWDIAPKDLEQFFKERDFDGINVTIPYKEDCLKYLDELSPLAKEIGAVNTVLNIGGKLFGYNTDYIGFLMTAKKLGVRFRNKKVIVLGFGGAGKAVKRAITDKGAKQVYVVTRTGEINFTNLYEKCLDAEIIVNATPLGRKGELFVDLNRLPKIKYAIDLNYDNVRTTLTESVFSKKIKSANGLFMLVMQAEMSNALFNRRVPNFKWAKRIYNKTRIEEENLSVIGMPGVGKTETGKVLAKFIGKDFFDSDEEYFNKYQITPSEEITKNGEEFFRQREKEIIKELSEKKNAVIATGGGAVISEENRKLLRRTSRVVYLKGNLKEKDISNRPILREKTFKTLYKERKEFYKSTKDFTVKNKGVEKTARKIVDKL